VFQESCFKPAPNRYNRRPINWTAPRCRLRLTRSVSEEADATCSLAFASGYDMQRISRQSGAVQRMMFSNRPDTQRAHTPIAQRHQGVASVRCHCLECPHKTISESVKRRLAIASESTVACMQNTHKACRGGDKKNAWDLFLADWLVPSRHGAVCAKDPRRLSSRAPRFFLLPLTWVATSLCASFPVASASGEWKKMKSAAHHLASATCTRHCGPAALLGSSSIAQKKTPAIVPMGHGDYRRCQERL